MAGCERPVGESWKMENDGAGAARQEEKAPSAEWNVLRDRSGRVLAPGK